MEKKKNVAKEKTVAKTDKVNKKEVVAKSKTADVKKKVKKETHIKFETTEQAEVKKFIIVILVVLLCVGAIYLFTRAFVSKDLFKKDEPKEEEVIEGEVDYEVAIMG